MKIEPTDNSLSEIVNAKKHYLKIAEEILNANTGNMYYEDIYILGSIKAALDTTAAFVLLVQNNHWLSCGALLRVHMDTLLRIYALWLTDDSANFVSKVLEGVQIDKLKDKDQKELRYSYIIERFFADTNNHEFTSLNKVYNETSGFVHFSHKHIMSIFSSVEHNNNYIRIGETISFDKQQTEEYLQTFITITKAQLKYIWSWKVTKDKHNT